MRLFFALWPDESTRAQLASLLPEVNGRKTKSANLHITLAFLGEQPDTLLPSLQKIVDELTIPPMTLVIDRIGYFKRQRIAWAGMQQVPESLLALQRALCDALEQHGIAFDRRNDFKPHITLARNAEPPDSSSVEPIMWHGRQVSLVHSAAGSAGVSYRVLASQYCNTPAENAESRSKEK